MEKKTVRVTIKVVVDDNGWDDRYSRDFEIVGDIEVVRSVAGNHVAIGAATVALIESTLIDYLAAQMADDEEEKNDA